MGNICVVYLLIGYRKNPLKKNTLIVDEKVAFIVKDIFSMYKDGHGSLAIVQYLTKRNFLSPKGYQKTGIIADKDLSKKYRWNEITVLNMLKNEVYIGNTVQNKTTVISYKIKKTRKNNKEKYIRVNHTHEAIIEKELFEKVSAILEKRGTNSQLKYEYLLRGLLICSHCKRRLQIVLKSNSRKNSIKYPYITCATHKKRGCYAFNMNYTKLEKRVLEVIKQICQAYVLRNDLYEVCKEYEDQMNDRNQQIERKMDEINKNIAEIDNELEQMYMDKLKNILSEETYLKYSQKVVVQRDGLMEQKKALEKQIKIEKSKTKVEKNWDKLIEDFLTFDAMDSLFLYQIINKIEIDKDKNVYIYFNFSKPN